MNDEQASAFKKAMEKGWYETCRRILDTTVRDVVSIPEEAERATKLATKMHAIIDRMEARDEVYEEFKRMKARDRAYEEFKRMKARDRAYEEFEAVLERFRKPVFDETTGLFRIRSDREAHLVHGWIVETDALYRVASDYYEVWATRHVVDFTFANSSFPWCLAMSLIEYYKQKDTEKAFEVEHERRTTKSC